MIHQRGLHGIIYGQDYYYWDFNHHKYDVIVKSTSCAQAAIYHNSGTLLKLSIWYELCSYLRIFSSGTIFSVTDYKDVPEYVYSA